MHRAEELQDFVTAGASFKLVEYEINPVCVVSNIESVLDFFPVFYEVLPALRLCEGFDALYCFFPILTPPLASADSSLYYAFEGLAHFSGSSGFPQVRP